MAWYFVPEDWQMSDNLRSWTQAQGLTDKQIETELEKFRDHQYKRKMMRPDACWRNWVRNAIKWGEIEITKQPEYRQPRDLTEEERRREQVKWEEDMRRLKVVK